MSVESFIALRYLLARKTHRFIAFLSFISLAGIFISVFSFLVIHSVMNGFSDYLREALIGFDSHMSVSVLKDELKDKELLSWLRSRNSIQSVIPVIELDGIIETGGGMTAGAKVRGIDPADIEAQGKVKTYLFGDYSLQSLKETEERMPGILVGEELYGRLKFLPGQEDIVSVIYPFGEVAPSGEVIPRRRNFRVIGILSTGFYEFDQKYVFLAPEQARRLSETVGPYTDFLVTAKSGHYLPALKKEITAQFPGVKAALWQEKNKRLFEALKLEKAGMFLLLSIVTFIASFNVLGLMTLFVLGKSKEMALLFALGMDRKQVRDLFVKVGLFLGGAGTALGLIFGLVAVTWLKFNPLPLPPAYYLEVLPVKTDFIVVAVLAVMAPTFAVLASSWPAVQAAKFKPMEVFRNN